MIIFPAIDLKDGKCVRLYKGDFNKTTIFNSSPYNQALQFKKKASQIYILWTLMVP